MASLFHGIYAVVGRSARRLRGAYAATSAACLVACGRCSFAVKALFGVAPRGHVSASAKFNTKAIAAPGALYGDLLDIAVSKATKTEAALETSSSLVVAASATAKTKTSINSASSLRVGVNLAGPFVIAASDGSVIAASDGSVIGYEVTAK